MTTGEYLSLLKTVGVKRLKARLSEYLRAVKAGETVLVTDHDEVVAELRPTRTRAVPPSDVAGVLELLADSGDV